ncbi:MAG: maleylpyruvate isomerase family protein [Chloroflexi bacterium]|nr:maleylpyruvate isomerase family protein [Chloroflexota bacterium]MYK34260.1 maleylpyruvate isomerase family protein [Chloroflexota bacterium]
MSKETFNEAVAFFLDTTSRVPDDAWTNEALGVWNVRDLVGHTSRAILLVEEYATEGTTRSGFGTPDEIAERGRQAGRALGDDSMGALRTLADRVLALAEGLPDDHPMHTPGGVRPLSRYLPSRVAELTIHTIDLANALGMDAKPPRECVRATLYVLADYAVREGTGAEVAFALTGRAPLPPGFSVVP